jgi:hypothetical protein
MLGNASASAEEASRGPHGMTPSGLEAHRVVFVVEMVAGEIVRGRPGC